MAVNFGEGHHGLERDDHVFREGWEKCDPE